MEMQALTDFVWSGALAGWPFPVGFFSGATTCTYIIVILSGCSLWDGRNVLHVMRDASSHIVR